MHEGTTVPLRRWSVRAPSLVQALPALAVLLPGLALAQPAVVPQTPPMPDPPAASPAQPTFLTDQGAQDIALAGAIGRPVVNEAGETIGELTNIIADAGGAIRAAVIATGGVLGVGRRDIAVDFRSLRITRDAKGAVTVVLPIDRTQLQAAPAFRFLGGG